MNTELTTAAPQAIATQHSGVDPTVQWAMSNGASPEMLRELYQLQREMRADQARAAYFEAFAAFKSEAIVIVKRTQVNDGPLKGKVYANLFDVVSVVTPILAKNQLSAAWKPTKDEPNWLEITCTISHRLGHSESAALGSGPDTGPGRNAIQARVSTISYLERITFLAACGLAAGGTDDDGSGAGAPEGKTGLLDGEIADRIDAIRAATTQDELKDVWAKANAAARKVKDVPAQQQFAREGERRKAELG